MKLMMASTEQGTTALAQREKFAFTAAAAREALQHIRAEWGVQGAVLLATCNRTELYLSVEEAIQPDRVLCAVAGVPTESAKGILKVRREESAARHLMKVACGLRSRILCEDQIITQVGDAARIAREEGCSDPVLETLFRMAVTAAKESKTTVHTRGVPLSAASESVRLVEQRLGGLVGKRALVIGNGEMGRLCADLLIARGCRVTVTLRTYRHGESVVPAGCAAIPYDARVAAVEGADLVVSATTSPHFTLTCEMLEGVRKFPRCFVDLAVPRDIEPEIAAMLGVECYNIDQFGGGKLPESALEQINGIIETQLLEFFAWQSVRVCRREIEEIKRLAVRRVSAGILGRTGAEADQALLARAVERTVDLLLYADKHSLTPDVVKRVRRSIAESKGGRSYV